MGMAEFSESANMNFEVVNTSSALTTRNYATYNGGFHTIVYTIRLRNVFFNCDLVDIGGIPGRK